MAWERVLTVNEFWDRPRLGIADVYGAPHIYQSPFDQELDDYADHYLVSPVDPELIALVLEDWAIWTRWSEAFDRGESTRETHPALPDDRRRHDELKLLIGSRLAADPENSRILWARFRNVRRGWNGLEVEWLSEPDHTLQT